MSQNTERDKAPRGFTLRYAVEVADPASHLAWAPDAMALAIVTRTTVWIRDASSAKHSQPSNQSTTRVERIAWSGDGRFIARYSINELDIWRVDTLELHRSFRKPMQYGVVQTLSWSPDNRYLATSSICQYSVSLWSPDTGNLVASLPGHTGVVTATAWSPTGRQVASASTDHTAMIHDIKGGARTLRGHNATLTSLAWSSNGETLATGSSDGTVRLWNVATGQQLRILQQSGPVTDVWLSPDQAILASRSGDSVQVWRTDRGELLARFDGCHSAAAFHPSRPLLALQRQNRILVCEVDSVALSAGPSVLGMSHYANAKIVLVGDTGVGKTGLGLVLSGHQFQPTLSTHGRQVWMLAVEKKEEEWNTTEVREVFLWDLAGQPGYRLIHQLHLDDVTVAMIVIDSRHDLDPFAGVRHWVRALRQAERSRGDVRTPISKILVAARTDRGGLSVSPERIRSLVDELDLDGYMETSAKTGRGIMELRIRILKSVNWDTLPRITSSVEFEQIRRFIVGEKKAGLIISSVSGLLESFAQTRTALLSQEFRNTFSVCLGLMESQGMVHRFSFGGMLLTQPEYLDAYAAAVIEMAKAEPDGLGSVSESKVVAAELQLASDDRLPSGQEEKLLCIATVEELLRRELVLREVAEDGVYLVFPSQLTRERPELPEPKGKQSTFSFTGPVLSVYATLVVRLSHSGSFERTQMWKQAVTFRTAANEACGLLLHDFGEGSASLTLFFETSTREATRARFEEYVQTHLYRRAVPESVKRRPILSCPRCGNELPPAAIDDGIKRGIGWLYCPTCEPPERVRIPGMSQTAAIAAGVAVAEMDLSAERARRRSAATAALQGKIATDDFDVFLAYNHVDVEIVEAVNAGLRERGLYAWLDVEQIPPGRWFQDVIQQVIPKIRCAAMFISRAGVGRWQELELRTFTSQCVERGIPVIPVLAGLRVSELPSGLLFLKELNHVTLSKEGVDSAALDSLEWGITGKRPPV